MWCRSGVLFVSLHIRKCFYCALVLHWLFGGYWIQDTKSTSIRMKTWPPHLPGSTVIRGKSDANLIITSWHMASFSSSLGEFLGFSIYSLEYFWEHFINLGTGVGSVLFCFFFFIYRLNHQQILFIWRLPTFFDSQELYKVWLLFSIYK